MVAVAARPSGSKGSEGFRFSGFAAARRRATAGKPSRLR